MNKKLLTIAIIIVLIIGSGMVYLMILGEDSQSNSESDSTQPVQQPFSSHDQAKNGGEESATSTGAGKYTEYSESAVSNTDGTKLLFFYAPWCPQCRELEASIKESSIPSGVTIFKVDYDTNQELRQKYGVTIQTTVVKVDDQGNIIEKFVAYDEPNFNSVRENLL